VKTIAVARMMEHAEARAQLIGHRVPTLTPNVTEHTLALDAETQRPVMIYAPLGNCSDLRWTVRTIKDFNGVNRAGSGYRTYSATFGTAPRKPVFQREGCASTAVKRDWPAQHAVLEHYATACQRQLTEVIGEELADSIAETRDIGPDWRLEDTIWTSGVINRTVAMPYHTDSSNYDVWSAMPVVRRGIRGGHLHIPEYGLVIDCRDSWCVSFPGFRLVHGVTPMKAEATDAYRYSVVFYALRGMKDCATTAQETRYAQQKRTERERRYAAELAEGLVQP
jgi:hypothetical protein